MLYCDLQHNLENFQHPSLRVPFLVSETQCTCTVGRYLMTHDEDMYTRMAHRQPVLLIAYSDINVSLAFADPD